MKLFSDCSGLCETCKIFYSCSCLAGHGDDDYVYADPAWIKQHELNQKLIAKGLMTPSQARAILQDRIK
jgi:hypothetical protein